MTYTDGDGATTTYTYNDLGRLTEIEEPGAGSPTIEYGYDSAGDVTSVTDEVGDTVTYTYNSVGEVLTEQNPVQAAASKDVSFTLRRRWQFADRDRRRWEHDHLHI